MGHTFVRRPVATLPFRRKRLIIPGLTALFLSILFLTRERILPAIGDFLVVQDDPHPTDLIHVPGGGTNTRLDQPVALYFAGGVAGGRDWTEITE